MYKQRLFSISATVALISQLLAANPARAQAPLGFTIDPTEGPPGTVVNGQVNPADIAEACITDTAGLQAAFETLFEGPYASGGNEGELFDHFFPNGEFEFTNCTQAAYSLTGFVVLGIGANIGGAADTALPQTFVMAFIDAATQRPVGERGTFDRTTGVGSVVVPNLPPGLQPIAATCVEPSLDVPMLEAGISANGAFLEALGAPPPCDINSQEFADFIQGIVGPGGDLFTFLNLIGPDLIANIVEPRGLGLQLFNVLPPPEPLDHFQCYDLRNQQFTDRTVTLADRFGERSATVRRAANMCTPSDKNGEDPSAPDHTGYLTSYSISKAGKFDRVRGQTVVDQFGTLTLDMVTPRSLLVPSSVSDEGPPSSPDGAFLNHFTCYDVRTTNRTTKFQQQTVSVTTPFETVDVTLVRPHRLCVPTDKNEEGTVDTAGPENLLCYKAKVKGPASSRSLFVDNQFGEQSYRLQKRQDFCVPADVNPQPTTTTTEETTSTTVEPTTTTVETTTTTEETTSTTLETTTTTVEPTTTTVEPTTTTSTSTTTTTMGSATGAFI